MRRLLLFLFIALAGLFYIAATDVEAIKNPRKLVYYSLCEKPLTYKIGSIDPRFGITSEDFATDIAEAAEIWSNEWGKPLFEYDKEGKITINMIYDERQSLNQQIGELENKLELDKSAVESKIAEFDRRSAEFKRKVEELNKQISDWNAKGGAPKDEYDRLKQQQQDLKIEAESLNEMARSLNRSTEQFNSEVSNLNQTVTSFNQALSEKPEQGLYKSFENEIDIYLTSSERELIHTLAHELGHALDMNHVEDEMSIMYTSTNQVTLPSAEDIQELKFACRERPVTEKVRKLLQEYIYQYQTSRKQT